MCTTASVKTIIDEEYKFPINTVDGQHYYIYAHTKAVFVSGITGIDDTLLIQGIIEGDLPQGMTIPREFDLALKKPHLTPSHATRVAVINIDDWYTRVKSCISAYEAAYGIIRDA